MILADVPQVEWKLSLDVRERFERRLDRDFLATNPDNRSDLFTRIRPTLEFRYGDRWSGALQFQYAHDWVWAPARNFSAENRDASEALVRYKDSKGTLTIGRQKIVAGGERLFGSGEWTNVGRSYDGVRFQSDEWDAFAAAIGVSAPRPRDARIAVVVRNWRGGKTLVAHKWDKTFAGDVRVATLDHSHRIARGAWDFDCDAALQWGKIGALDHEAWAAHVGAGYRPSPRDRAYLDLNAASGGQGTAKSRTFDNLYPTNHKFYGSMDLQAWKNMREIALGWQRKLTDRADLHVHAHRFWLMDSRDAWYAASGAPNSRFGGFFKDPSGASGTDVGLELDVEGAIRIDPLTTVGFGVAFFEPGKFVERMNGGSAQRQTWFYVQVIRRG